MSAPEKLKNELLDLLNDDSDIRRAIIGIIESCKSCANGEASADIAPGKMHELENKNNRLQDENTRLLHKQKLLEEELQDVKNVKQKIEEKLNETAKHEQELKRQVQEKEKSLDELQKICSSLKREKADIDKVILPFQNAYKVFCSLSPKVKEQLNGIFPNDNLWDFIFCGTREDNLTSLWDFCANTLKNGGDNLTELEQLFDFFLSCNHRQYATPKFKRLSLNCGEEFDENSAQRDRTSRPIGQITTVLFQGIAYAANDKVVRKSIVHVE